MAVHLFVAVIILIGGPLQMIPHLRHRAPSFIDRTAACTCSPVHRHDHRSLHSLVPRNRRQLSQHVSVSLDAVLIMILAVLGVRYGIVHD